MKLAVMNDLSVSEYRGGTEYYSAFLVRAAKDQGHQAEVITPAGFYTGQLADIDVVIMTNVSRFEQEDIKWILEHKPTIKIEMDYGFCRGRNGYCAMCHRKEDEGTCIEAPDLYYKHILENVSRIVFLNPHQMERYRTVFGDIVNNSIIAMSFYAYPSEFVDYGKPRIPNSLFFPHRFYFEKGIFDAIDMAAKNPQGNFFFMGFGDERVLPMIQNLSNCTYLGNLPEDRRLLQDYYNMFEAFISMPVWEDTGPIKVVEAELCGMKILGNQNNKIQTNGWQGVTELREMIDDARESIFELAKELASEIF